MYNWHFILKWVYGRLKILKELNCKMKDGESFWPETTNFENVIFFFDFLCQLNENRFCNCHCRYLHLYYLSSNQLNIKLSFVKYEHT